MRSTIFLFALLSVSLCSLRAFDVRNFRSLMSNYLQVLGVNSTNATGCLTAFHARVWEAESNGLRRINWNNTVSLGHQFVRFANASLLSLNAMTKCSGEVQRLADELKVRLSNESWFLNRVNETFPKLKNGLKIYVLDWSRKLFDIAGSDTANVTSKFFFGYAGEEDLDL